MNKNQITAKILKINLAIAILVLTVGFIMQVAGNDFAKPTINIGLLYVIMMPVIRVFMELVYFTKKRNYTYILICISLIIVIVISIAC